jgi:hypothetical protein
LHPTGYLEYAESYITSFLNVHRVKKVISFCTDLSFKKQPKYRFSGIKISITKFLRGYFHRNRRISMGTLRLRNCRRKTFIFRVGTKICWKKLKEVYVHLLKVAQTFSPFSSRDGRQVRRPDPTRATNLFSKSPIF